MFKTAIILIIILLSSFCLYGNQPYQFELTIKKDSVYMKEIHSCVIPKWIESTSNTIENQYSGMSYYDVSSIKLVLSHYPHSDDYTLKQNDLFIFTFGESSSIGLFPYEFLEELNSDWNNEIEPLEYIISNYLSFNKINEIKRNSSTSSYYDTELEAYVLYSDRLDTEADTKISDYISIKKPLTKKEIIVPPEFSVTPIVPLTPEPPELCNFTLYRENLLIGTSQQYNYNIKNSPLPNTLYEIIIGTTEQTNDKLYLTSSLKQMYREVSVKIGAKSYNLFGFGDCPSTIKLKETGIYKYTTLYYAEGDSKNEVQIQSNNPDNLCKVDKLVTMERKKVKKYRTLYYKHDDKPKTVKIHTTNPEGLVKADQVLKLKEETPKKVPEFLGIIPIILVIIFSIC